MVRFERSSVAAVVGYSIHVARQGRPGRHFVMFRVARDGSLPTIEVVRVLYDGMDLRRHVDAT